MPNTPNLGIPELEPGSGSKDVVVNTALAWLDTVVAGILSKSVAGGVDVTLTTAPMGGEAANSKITLTGALSANINVILPMFTRIWRIIDSTTGGHTITIKGLTGTGVTFSAGDDFFVRFDGTNFVRELIAPYIVGIQGQGVPTPGVPILVHRFTVAVTYSAGLPHASFKSRVAATATTNFDIQKNGSSIGTMSFAASATVPTFTFASNQAFVIDDELTIWPPGSADATLAGICGSIRGDR